jgi:type II secretory pathway pseudopilin PulG
MTGHGQRDKGRRAGFTVTEVVVASAVMATVFLALMGFFSFARRSGSLTENRLACTHIAREAMETLRSRAYTAEELSPGLGKRPLPGFPNDRGYYDVVENADGNTKDITVVVEWEEPWGMKQSVSLTTSHSRGLHQ